MHCPACEAAAAFRPLPIFRDVAAWAWLPDRRPVDIGLPQIEIADLPTGRLWLLAREAHLKAQREASASKREEAKEKRWQEDRAYGIGAYGPYQRVWHANLQSAPRNGEMLRFVLTAYCGKDVLEYGFCASRSASPASALRVRPCACRWQSCV